jgi:hypothetical protein
VLQVRDDPEEEVVPHNHHQKHIQNM